MEWKALSNREKSKNQTWLLKISIRAHLYLKGYHPYYQ